ncbi:hypothetical protein ABTN38_19875, partial [Acinetobacter baumannii]
HCENQGGRIDLRLHLHIVIVNLRYHYPVDVIVRSSGTVVCTYPAHSVVGIAVFATAGYKDQRQQNERQKVSFHKIFSFHNGFFANLL